MNKQRIFSRVAHHLLKQKKQAKTDSGEFCAYMSSQGLKCAVGCLIPKRLYSAALEGDGVNDLLCKSPELKKHLEVKTSDIWFLNGLQRIHDNTKPKEWKEGLIEFAQKENLKLPGCLK